MRPFATLEVARHAAVGAFIPTDVSHPHDVQTLAERTLAEFGRIDVWVNNAAVGPFEEVPIEQFLAQRSGILINIASEPGRHTVAAVCPRKTGAG